MGRGATAGFTGEAPGELAVGGTVALSTATIRTAWDITLAHALSIEARGTHRENWRICLFPFRT